ncbi:nicotinate (nicotinamide) nucleotide adenylyltransferase [Porphyromonas pogonae]|uniref:nicotinate (nicotinamide) nucleotide adenylyltransferase n=1 Tax=Porphyromonas pogonae TaxID=867595 RepID=UPI002E7640B0|nr:nicotinate (nicotinamide) nucleotide adenylyltransferase [Porphyromonas pogonae]
MIKKEKNGSRKIGLYFGSFNPLHIGHMALANYTVEQYGFDEIWLVLSPLNPHKNKSDQLDFDFRSRLIIDTFQGNPRYKLCCIEAYLPHPHYTVNTVRALHMLYPGDHFSLIIGADNWSKIELWHAYEVLLNLLPIYIYPRNGYDFKERNISGKFVYMSEAPLLEISSTMIRQAIAQGKDFRFWINDPYKWEELVNEYNKLKL